MMMHICAILWKQLKDTLKNKVILIQFMMFPCMTIIMENAITIEGMPEHFFANLFSVMYIGMAPLTCAGAIISEEKGENTLRVLQTCNVSGVEYLVGNALYIVSLCMMGSLAIGIAGGYSGVILVRYMLIMLIGHGCSFLIGASVGVMAKNQMTATSITVAVMMILSFLPMISFFNETIKKFSKVLFSEQLYILMNNLEGIKITAETGIIFGCNLFLIVIIFFRAYRKIRLTT